MNLTAFITGIGFALNPMLSVPAAPQAGGVWVTLCASGAQIWIDLSGNGEQPDSPPPSAPHTKACHAVCCPRGDLDTDSADSDDDSSAA